MPSTRTPSPKTSAARAGLRYVSDERPGITRHPDADGFVYRDERGRKITRRDELERIRKLAIPPAWTDVWICPDPEGHLLATGRDAAGRKQYRYHPDWRKVRDETKYDRMLAFGAALPAIRARVEADLAKPGLPREKVLATVVRLLETTLIRVGNDEYAKQNGSYGLTTMRRKHVTVAADRIEFKFRGKSGVKRSVAVRDRKLARIVKKCRDLPGYDLFVYVDDDGERRSIGSGDVNDYLREISGADFTAKDFRTWAGSVLALATLRTVTEYTAHEVVQAVEQVAEQLGNTPAVCRKCYIHPRVLETFLEGALDPNFPRTGARSLQPEEKALLALLSRPVKRSRVAA